MNRQLRSMRRLLGAIAATAVAATAAQAQVSWTDWTSTGANTVSGTMQFGSNTVGVTYTGSSYFTQMACGADFWMPNVYTGGGVPNAPGNCEIIALSTGGPKTISFSQAVVDPLVALVSWNNQGPITFNGPLQVVGTGCGYWGCGTMVANGNVLTMTGEAHGTVRLLGTYSSITFTDGDETWHGFTVGAASIATSAVPEPATMALTATGLLGLIGVVRLRRSR